MNSSAAAKDARKAFEELEDGFEDEVETGHPVEDDGDVEEVHGVAEDFHDCVEDALHEPRVPLDHLQSALARLDRRVHPPHVLAQLEGRPLLLHCVEEESTGARRRPRHLVSFEEARLLPRQVPLLRSNAAKQVPRVLSAPLRQAPEEKQVNCKLHAVVL